MDKNKMMREWTNEEHEKFLNSIEASFVRAMLADGAPNNEHKKQKIEDSSSHKDCLLRLDRFLPDSCDSTEDLPTQRRRSHHYTPTQSDGMADNKNRSTVKAERKRRRSVRCQPYASLQDQVGELRRRE